jgi:hypothetical protein
MFKDYTHIYIMTTNLTYRDETDDFILFCFDTHDSSQLRARLRYKSNNKHMKLIEVYTKLTTPMRMEMECLLDVCQMKGQVFYLDCDPNRMKLIIDSYFDGYSLEFFTDIVSTHYNKWLLKEDPWKMMEIDDETETYDDQYISFTRSFDEKRRLVQIKNKYNDGKGCIGYEIETYDDSAQVCIAA